MRRWKALLGAAVLTVVATVGVVGGVALAGSAVSTKPFKELRAVVNADGTQFVGSGGYTLGHPSTGQYTVSFPAGTFDKKTSTTTIACFYEPTITGLFGSIPTITSYTTFGDGSGALSVSTGSADAPWVMQAVSAQC